MMAIRWDRRANRAPSWWRQCRYTSGKKMALTRRMMAVRHQSAIRASRVHTVNNYDLFRKPGIPDTSSLLDDNLSILNNKLQQNLRINADELQKTGKGKERVPVRMVGPSKSSWCGYANFFRYEKSSLPRGRYRWKFKILDVYAERLQKIFILFWHQWLGMGALIFQLSVCIKRVDAVIFTVKIKMVWR